MSRKSTRQSRMQDRMQNGNTLARVDALREVCPCRNKERDPAAWRDVFETASDGSYNERKQAAHAIGTLLQKAAASPAWRSLLAELEPDLDRLMAHDKASTLVLAQMKRHGHAHRGAAMQAYRRHRKVLELTTPASLATWVNRHFGLQGARRVSARHPGVDRLWRWHEHRQKFQPGRRTTEDEVVAMAERFVGRGS